MQVAGLPEHESDRLQRLRDYDLLDTAAERGFDDLVALAADLFDVPIALVSLVDEKRQWFKAKIGLTACESGRDESFCSHAILSDEVLVVPDARRDPRFHDNPFVLEPPYIRFYAGAPLVAPDGHAIGTLCVIDSEPRELTVGEIGQLRRLASQAMDQAELRVVSRRARRAFEALDQHREQLEATVEARTRQVAQTREAALRCLARAAEWRDDDTGQHIQRVSRYAGLIAEAMGWSETAAKHLSLAATLHDVGKIAIPDAVLLKPSRLSEVEFTLMQEHARRGGELVRSLTGDDHSWLQRHCDAGTSILGSNGNAGDGDDALLDLAARIAATHHERWDGLGYPRGLAGEDIPVEGRIVAVADVYDALSSKRPYKPAFADNKCFEILKGGSGSQFDPAVIDAFFRRADDVKRIREELGDPAESAAA